MERNAIFVSPPLAVLFLLAIPSSSLVTASSVEKETTQYLVARVLPADPILASTLLTSLLRQRPSTARHLNSLVDKNAIHLTRKQLKALRDSDRQSQQFDFGDIGVSSGDDDELGGNTFRRQQSGGGFVPGGNRLVLAVGDEASSDPGTQGVEEVEAEEEEAARRLSASGETAPGEEEEDEAKDASQLSEISFAAPVAASTSSLRHPATLVHGGWGGRRIIDVIKLWRPMRPKSRRPAAPSAAAASSKSSSGTSSSYSLPLNLVARKRSLGRCINRCINGGSNMNFIQCKSMCH